MAEGAAADRFHHGHGRFTEVRTLRKLVKGSLFVGRWKRSPLTDS